MKKVIAAELEDGDVVEFGGGVEGEGNQRCYCDDVGEEYGFFGQEFFRDER
jgi:hypothetical protein